VSGVESRGVGRDSFTHSHRTPYSWTLPLDSKELSHSGGVVGGVCCVVSRGVWRERFTNCGGDGDSRVVLSITGGREESELVERRTTLKKRRREKEDTG
jgi:hypothetical protein